VRILLLPARKHLLIAPAKAGAQGALPLQPIAKRGHYLNASTLLQSAYMAVTTGYRELYPVQLIKRTPLGPAIAIQMGRRLQARREWRPSKRTGEEP
jgi:hypothetical protein